MNELINIKNQDGVLTVSSREIARNFEKNHQHVLRDIDNLMEGVQKWTDLFYETTYVHEQNKQTYREILLTRDGFTLLAMGFTGKKAIGWKLKYIEAFNKMESIINNPELIRTSAGSADKEKLADAKLMNARTRMSNQFLKLANVDTLSTEYKNILVVKAAEVLSGEKLLPLPKSKQKTYSAKEMGDMFGVSANKIGRIANINGLKTPEYGEYYRSKSEHSSKEVDTWVYFDSVIPVFEDLLKSYIGYIKEAQN